MELILWAKHGKKKYCKFILQWKGVKKRLHATCNRDDLIRVIFLKCFFIAGVMHDVLERCVDKFTQILGEEDFISVYLTQDQF